MLRNLYLINKVLREEVVNYYSEENKKSFGVGRANEKQNQMKEIRKIKQRIFRIRAHEKVLPQTQS